MARTALEIRGLSALIANFRAFDVDLRDEMAFVNERTMHDVRDLARQLSPVDTGRMRAAITPELSEMGLAFRVFVDERPFAAEGLTYYPPFVHDGTRFMPARPFLFEAFEEMHPIYLQDIREAGRRSIQRVGR